MAASVGAGLWGIENEVEAPPPVRGDAGEGHDDPAKKNPRTLAEATARLKQSERARAILGDAFVDHYVRTREWEVRQFDRVVTEWELRRYFESI